MLNCVTHEPTHAVLLYIQYIVECRCCHNLLRILLTFLFFTCTANLGRVYYSTVHCTVYIVCTVFTERSAAPHTALFRVSYAKIRTRDRWI